MGYRIISTPGGPAMAPPPAPAPAERKKTPARIAPIDNGRDALLSVYPDAHVTSWKRTADDPLTKANPTSYHYNSGGAVDIRPIPGMTFDQYVQGFVDKGYSIVEAKNEVGAGRSKHATGDHWHVVLGGGPADAPADDLGPPTFNNAAAKFKVISTPADAMRGTVGPEAAPVAPAEAPMAPELAAALETVRPRETASASAVVVPATMQEPPTPQELEAIQGYPADVQPYVLAKARGLDHDQAAAFAESVAAEAARAEAAKPPSPELSFADQKVKDAKGRLATLVQSATLGFGDDLVGLVAPETAEAMNTERADYAKRNPVSAALVTLMGGAAPTGALNAGLRRLGAAEIPVASSAARGLTSFETAAGLGPKLRNALRIGGQGAIIGGADAAGNDSSVAGGVALGFGAGALLGPAAEAVIKGGRALLASPAAKAIRALASRLGRSPTRLSREWAQFEAITGRPPSIAEIADDELAQELAAIGRAKKGAEKIFVDADTAADRARPQRLADEITGDAIPAPRRRGGMGGPVPNVGDEAVARRTAMDDEMVRIGGNPVAITGDEFQRFMGSPEIQRAARNDPQLRRAMATAAEDFAAAGDDAADIVSNAFTVRDMEGLRQLLRREQASAVEGGLGNIGDQYRRMSEDIIDLVTAEVPRYGAALRRFGEDSRRITGIEEGLAGRTARDAKTVETRRELTTPEGRAGNVEGLRGRLVDEATASERGAIKTAEKLTETETDEARIFREMFGRDEAKRLARIGRVETRAAENLDRIARPTSPTERQNLTAIAAGVAETAALGGSQATLWFKVRQGVKLLKAMGMTADKARRIATLTTVPGRSRQTIDALLEEGLTEQQIRQFFNQYGGDAGVMANEMTTRKRRKKVADED